MIFTVLSKFFSSTAFYLIIAAVIASAIGYLYYDITSKAEELQSLKDQVVTLKTAVKEQSDANEQLRQLIQLNNDSIANLESEKEKIKGDVDTLNSYLTDKKTVETDRPSSDILKHTIEELMKRK